jgi:hypothetical protein
MRIKVDLTTQTGYRIAISANVKPEDALDIGLGAEYMEKRLILTNADFKYLKDAAKSFLSSYDTSPKEKDEVLFKTALEFNTMKFKHPFFMDNTMAMLIVEQDLPW